MISKSDHVITFVTKSMNDDASEGIHILQDMLDLTKVRGIMARIK